MPARTPQPESAEFLVCNVSFVGYYDGDGLRQFVARKGQTIIEADSREAKLWGRSLDADQQPLFKPVTPSYITAAKMADPYMGMETPERRGD